MIRVILTDIEGTTSSISFVHDVLFPYSAEHMADFVREGNADSIEIREQLDAVAQISGVARDDIEGLIGVLETWIREDRKETPLKALQGMLWAQGYQRGAFRGHVYEDAAEYLQRWHDRGLRLFVYSSGSVKAQKLIFGFSEAGDLTPFFSGYFDTRVGGKKEPESYSNIVSELGVDPGTVLFLSDVEAELQAAEKAGMRTVWLIREGDLAQTGRAVARDFAGVDSLLQQR
ncbi:acireductone synthase [Marinobacter orientalis]|uniref:Enolase-phosphatase E1 n=1 Tax=Marinobacter orientalis TaxID=1928859 RepID=A0A7Y0WU23_9GAMM|nr:acireductone synthase [Marinobacter orientalis]NMT65412.1 acireductone synthase [Marinobacter orientalis]TGX47642.1 acireductone synthase [Marinobacter orientalis]